MRIVRRLEVPGRLVPRTAARLRSRSIRLAPGEQIEWHSTGAREELLIGLEGVVELERRDARNRTQGCMQLSSGQSLFLPRRVWHRVANRSRRPARYLYVTG